MKKIMSIVALISAMVISTSVAAAPNYTFGNVSINKVDWTSGSTDRAPHHKDFDFIEVEGGAGYDWGELYGFVDFEQFASYKKAEDMKVSAKGVATLNTAVPNLALYTQTFTFLSKDFKTMDSVIGMSYKVSGEGWMVRPFVGAQLSVHDADFNPEMFHGLNGAMVGWAAMYDFQIGDEKFSLTNWNEISLLRSEEYVRISGEGSKTGLNGAVGLWWNASPKLTTGVQYRYADKKLGSSGYMNGAIYTVKYNF